MSLTDFLTRSRFAVAVQRWTGDPGVCFISAMVFVIRFEGGALPEYVVGPPGRELSCYIPDDLPWKQINFGQGEGQADIAGNEWGFYHGPPDSGELHVVLHSGDLDPPDAVAFVNAIAMKLGSRSEKFTVNLRGIKELRHQRPC